LAGIVQGESEFETRKIEARAVWRPADAPGKRNTADPTPHVLQKSAESIEKEGVRENCKWWKSAKSAELVEGKGLIGGTGSDLEVLSFERGANSLSESGSGAANVRS
jgi:hypothetical protein